mmetsp:Transcript_43928/g.42458  ORF Transcript_43928/g.42458 Transcript_43928/m.42458 type:complete len:108 (+) Transcript_43928:22-345(+)
MNTDDDKELLGDQINITTNDKSKTVDVTKEGGTGGENEGSSKKKWMIIGIVIAVLVVAGAVVAMAVVLPDGGGSLIPNPDGFEILPADTTPVNTFAVLGTPTDDQYT